MERLTFEGLFCDIAMCQNTPGGTCCETGMCFQRKVWERLKEWEDTGLDLEKLRLNVDIDFCRFIELLEADAEDRLVVLPCKVGTPVYVVGERRIMKCDTYEIRQDNVSGLEYLLSFECDDDCDGCPFNSWHQDYSGEYSCHGEWGEWCVKGAEFGKTVFLTPEEAEAALKGGAV